MFLNLKSKKVTDYMLTTHLKNPPQIHSYREGSKQRPSRESRQIKSTRQHHNPNTKKPISNNPTSTLISNQSNYLSSLNPRQQSQQKQLIEECQRSKEKIDSLRIANAYRKIKKYDTTENVPFNDNLERDFEKKKLQNRSQRIAHKKQLLNTIANNYICTTEADQIDFKRVEQITDRSSPEGLMQLLEPFMELFSWEMEVKETASVPLRTRIHSSRQGEISRSNERSQRNMSKQTKKRSNQILIRDSTTLTIDQETQTIHEVFKNFVYKVEQAQYKIKNMDFSAKTKYVQHPYSKCLERFLRDIECFMVEMYQKYLKQMENSYSKYEKSMMIIVKEEERLQKRCEQLENHLKVVKQKNEILQKALFQLKNKTIFAEAVIGQISHHFDVDSFIRCRFEEELYGTQIIKDPKDEHSDHRCADKELKETSPSLPKKKGQSKLQLHNDHYNEFLDFNVQSDQQSQRSAKSFYL